MAATAEIYIELIVGFPEDPKVRGLLRYGPDARGLRDLYVQMALYCKRNLSDGFVPEEEVGILVYPDSWENGLRDAERLVQARLLEKVDGGYIVLAFAKRNRTKAEVIRLTEEKAAGGALGNHRRWHKNGVVKPDCIYCQSDTDRSSDSESDQESESHTDRTSESDPNRERSPETETETETEEKTSSPGLSRAESSRKFDELWKIYPRKVGKAEARKSWDKAIKKGTNPDRIIEGALTYARDPNRMANDLQFTAHPSTWLNQGRWDDEPPPASGNNGGGGWWNN